MERYRLRIHTENEAVARKCFTLLRKTFSINSDVSVHLHKRNGKGSQIYTLLIRDHAEVLRVLQALKLVDAAGEIQEQVSPANQLLVQKSCCRRAFIRGAFLAAGSISNPEKSYHFEIVCVSPERAEQLQALIRTFGLDAKTVQRKKHYIVYIKEGAQIVDMLKHHGSACLFGRILENIRIVRCTCATHASRKAHCEAANINKTVSASVKQMRRHTDIWKQEQVFDHSPPIWYRLQGSGWKTRMPL